MGLDLLKWIVVVILMLLVVLNGCTDFGTHIFSSVHVDVDSCQGGALLIGVLASSTEGEMLDKGVSLTVSYKILLVLSKHQCLNVLNTG